MVFWILRKLILLTNVSKTSPEDITPLELQPTTSHNDSSDHIMNNDDKTNNSEECPSKSSPDNSLNASRHNPHMDLDDDDNASRDQNLDKGKSPLHEDRQPSNDNKITINKYTKSIG